MLQLKGPQQSARCLAFSPDGRLLASAAPRAHEVIIWNAVTGQPEEVVKVEGLLAPCLTFEPSKGRLLTATWAGRVSLWDPSSREFLSRPLPSPRSQITCLAFSRTGTTLAVGGLLARSYAVWLLMADGDQGARVLTGGQQVVYCVAFSPDGRFLVAGTEEGATLWDVDAGRAVTALPRPSAVRAAAYADGGRTLALAESRGATLWDTATGEVRAAVEGQDGLVTCVAFGPGGGLLATGSWGGVVRLWAVSAGRQVAAYDWDVGRVNAVAFSPDGMRAAAGGETGIVIWDVDDLLA
jgi:WD40 repeat protein